MFDTLSSKEDITPVNNFHDIFLKRILIYINK